MLTRYYIEISFKGTNFHGWQKQPNGISVQETISNALCTIVREDIEVTGAGRTDTGVHAHHYVAHFDCKNDSFHNNSKILYSLNSILPRDIVIHGIYRVKPEMHARFDAIARTYSYTIISRKDPFNHELSYFVSNLPNHKVMNECTQLLKNHTDFSCFCKAHSDVKTKLCTITHAQWTESNGTLVFTITANRFLRNMVRAIVGTLLEVGYGKMSRQEFMAVLESKDRGEAGWSVPAQGLSLITIEYPYDYKKLMCS